MKRFNFWSKRYGFTLAETLVTLLIIGVVAAIAIPPLMTNITDRVFAQEQDLAIKKIREATNQMKSNDVLGGYATNDAFADEFQKYIKITKRCTSTNLANCFISKFQNASGESINISDLTSGTNLGHATYTSPTVGMILINGTTMVFAFDPACARIDPFDNKTDTTSCMSIVYDVNGLAKPNIIGKDIALLNATLDTCTGAKIGGLCIAASDTTYSSIDTCTDTTYDSHLTANTYCASNMWAGAKKACADQNMRLPDINELNTIYQNRASISGLSLNSNYFSTTEWSSTTDFLYLDFNDGSQRITVKYDFWDKVRCVK